MCKKATAAGALLALIAGPAFAQSDNPEGLYIGAGIGDFSSDVDGLDAVDDANIDLDDDEDATKLFGGWRFNNFVAVQLDYVDFGGSSAATELLDITTDTKGIAPSVVGTLPLGPVELFGRAGVIFYDLEINAPSESLVDVSGEDAVVGVGVGGTLLERLNLRVEYERTDIEELDDADAVWLTAHWRF